MHYRLALRAVTTGAGVVELASFDAVRHLRVDTDDIEVPDDDPLTWAGHAGPLLLRLPPWGPGPRPLVPTGSVEWIGQDRVPVWVPDRAFVSWRAAHPPVVFTCWNCGRTSHHPTDLAEAYCGACHGAYELMVFTPTTPAPVDA